MTELAQAARATPTRPNSEAVRCEEALNTLGEDGWELVTFYVNGAGSFRKMDTPRGRQIGSIGITVLPGGRIKMFYDGGLGNELGTIKDVNSDQIDELLVSFLRELSRELSAKSSQ